MKIPSIGKTAVLALFLIAGHAFAAYSAYLYENGGNVIASGSGSFNLAGAGVPFPSAAGDTLIRGSGALLYTGPNGLAIPTDLYGPVGFAGPASFGPGVAFEFASSNSGDTVGLVGLSNRFFVKQGYVSGSPLSSSATWNGKTLATLGVTPGTYTWTWGAGANADSYTLTIGSAPPVQSIPTLGQYGLMILSLLLLAVAFTNRGTVRKS